MKVITDDGVDVNAPGTLVLSGFLHVPDVTKRVTPELQQEESSLVWFPCASERIKEKIYG
jgi:phosphoribosylformylglycinamidine (FGAM) synthase-like enzyme